jgi:hypothetical protein
LRPRNHERTVVHVTVHALHDPAAVIKAVEKATGAARSVDDVLVGVVEVLGASYDLCRVSLRAPLPGGTEVEVLAVWSRRPSDLGAGVRMPMRATSMASIIATGRTQVGTDVQAADGLLHELLVAEGIRSYVAVPLGDVAAGAPVLNLSSSRADAFSDADVPLVDAVGAVVAQRLAKLSRAR